MCKLEQKHAEHVRCGRGLDSVSAGSFGFCYFLLGRRSVSCGYFLLAFALAHYIPVVWIHMLEGDGELN